MAEVNEQEKEVTHVGETYESLTSFLCNEERDFLTKNNGDKVSLLYFMISFFWFENCIHGLNSM